MKATIQQEHGYYNIIHNIVSACNFSSYLELGVDTGYNIKKVADNCPNLKTIVGVDLKNFDSMKFLQNQKMNPRMKIYANISTDDFFANKSGEYGQFDCVFIDACHAHSQVIIDYENSYKLVPNDGIIFLHDTYPPNLASTGMDSCGDTYKTYLQLKNDKNIDIINLPIWVGLTIIRKHSEKNIETI